jgi:hypothetical protein
MNNVERLTSFSFQSQKNEKEQAINNFFDKTRETLDIGHCEANSASTPACL